MNNDQRTVNAARSMRDDVPGRARINSSAAFQALLRHERNRVDRDGSEFSLAVFDVSTVKSNERRVQRVADRIREKMRSIDEVGWIGSRSLGVLLPVTDLEGGKKFVHRVGESTPCMVYAYPSHWLPGSDADDTGHGSPSRKGMDSVSRVFCQRIPVWKSFLDMAGSLVLIVLLSPLFLIMAFYVKVVSPGKVLYMQKRVGYRGKIFTFIKFRTMHEDNDPVAHREYLRELIRNGRPMEKLDGGRDPRIIPGGKIIRKMCLDELPQLFNVLRGEMSLVGPRPCIPYEADEYLRWHAHRFDTLPGMTGPWQVSGKNKLSFEKMIRLDIAYANRMSLLLDLKILLLTVPAIVRMVFEAGARRIDARRMRSGRKALPTRPRRAPCIMHNLAVIGCGYWGPNLVRNFRSLPGVNVVAICDKSQERLDHLGRLYPEVKKSTDLAGIVYDSSIDAVAIATPVSTHHGLAMACLGAGKHVFVEKPLAVTSAQCSEMIELAESRALTLMVGHTFVYTATVRKIKEIVNSGEIGEIMNISCRRLNLGLFQKDINVAWDLAPHDISIILFILGKNPVAVNCQGKAHVSPGIEDITNLSLIFSNGGFATIQSSWIDPRKVREITIVGTKKMIVYDDTEPLEKVKIYDKRVEAPPHYDTFGEFQYSYHYGDICSPFVRQEEPLKAECQHFVDCIDRGATPDSSGRDGLAVVRILEAATESLRKGGGKIPLEGRP